MKTLIVDGLNVFIRNFVVVPAMDADGGPVGGVVGFLKGLRNLLSDINPGRVIVVWDGPGGSRRRRGIFAEYKQGRKVRLNRAYDMESSGDSANNMDAQLKKLHGLLDQLGVLQIEADDVEADDVIAFLCKFVLSDDEKVVVSSDRDMLQLVDDRTLVYSPSKKKYWTSLEMRESMHVLPENYIYMKAMVGDASDNIAGLGGIGEKTVAKLFPFLAERPTDLREILAHAEANKSSGAKYSVVVEQWDRMLENVRLMQLSSPIISPQTARSVRLATEQRPKFVFTGFKLELVRHGIASFDQGFLFPFQALKARVEATS